MFDVSSDFLNIKNTVIATVLNACLLIPSSVWFSGLFRACSYLSSSLHNDNFLLNDRHHGPSL